eukprot:scaffold284623_cov35-Tisochrysis_lutea.AAC.1
MGLDRNVSELPTRVLARWPLRCAISWRGGASCILMIHEARSSSGRFEIPHRPVGAPGAT